MKLAKDRKMHIAAYITVALELYEKESMDDIFAPYFFEYVVNKKNQFFNFGIVLVGIRYIIITDTIFSSKHWICLMITPKLSNVLVLDSLDNDSKCYRDLLATIQT